MRLIACAAVLVGLFLSLVPAAAPGMAEELSIDMPSGPRTAILRPAPKARAPTVIVLHGALVSAEKTESWYGFAGATRRHGFAAVYPRGLHLLWNDGRNGTPGSDADDVGFLKRLAGELVARGIAHPARLYLVGVSNGGMLALRMLCEAPEPFAAIATVIASMPEAVGARCRSEQPVPVIMLNGTADPLIPYGGGVVGFTSLQGRVWPVERTALFLATRNGCTDGTKAVVSGSAGGRDGGTTADRVRVVKLDWRHCRSEHGVTLYRVEGAGHQVFGTTNFLPLLLGSGTRRVSTPDVIMRAFSKGVL